MKRRLVILFFMFFTITIIIYGLNDYIITKNVESDAKHFLVNIEQGEYDQVLNQLYISDDLKKAIKKEDLRKLTSQLSGDWSLKQVDFRPLTTNNILVVLYINEVPESLPGRHDFIDMWEDEGQWKVGLHGFLEDIQVLSH